MLKPPSKPNHGYWNIWILRGARSPLFLEDTHLQTWILSGNTRSSFLRDPVSQKSRGFQAWHMTYLAPTTFLNGNWTLLWSVKDLKQKKNDKRPMGSSPKNPDPLQKCLVWGPTYTPLLSYTGSKTLLGPLVRVPARSLILRVSPGFTEYTSPFQPPPHFTCVSIGADPGGQNWLALPRSEWGSLNLYSLGNIGDETSLIPY